VSLGRIKQVMLYPL